MIMVTGGAGFIGSNLHAALARQGTETVVVDRLGCEGKWRNLAKHPPARLIGPDTLDEFLDSHPPIETIVHLGAISDTTETDGDSAWATNVALPARLWTWCAARGVRFLYASSAATYGDGGAGFDDDAGPEYLARLRPLNLYGWTKHAFDRHLAAMLLRGEPRPPQWAGLKFFNVYGPNEYHKGGMVSAIKVKHDELAAGGPARLFRSIEPGIADGDQKRDFVWVGDAVAVLLWLLETPAVNGLFNVGTGTARSYADMARAVCGALGAPERIAFIDMPESLRGGYQSFTEARTERPRAAGYARPFTMLEDGIATYVRDYLSRADPYA